MNPPSACPLPPPGWICSRAAGHAGPCAALILPIDDSLLPSITAFAQTPGIHPEAAALIEAARKVHTGEATLQDVISTLRPQEEDPYQSEDYQRFVATCGEHCHAEDAPCDSCLAGGICDVPSDNPILAADINHSNDHDIDLPHYE